MQVKQIYKVYRYNVNGILKLKGMRNENIQKEKNAI